MAATSLPSSANKLEINSPDIDNSMSLSNVLYLKEEYHTLSTTINSEEGIHDLNIKVINKLTKHNITLDVDKVITPVANNWVDKMISSTTSINIL